MVSPGGQNLDVKDRRLLVKEKQDSQYRLRYQHQEQQEHPLEKFIIGI